MCACVENSFCFILRQSLDEMDGIFSGATDFINRDGFHLKGQASLGKQITPARRCGCKH